MSCLDAALNYVHQGISVLAVRGDAYGDATGGGTGNPKAPLGSFFPHGVNDATTDPDLIRAAFTEHPLSWVAAATGKGNRVVVVDVDAPNGFATLAALEAEHGELPATRAQSTRSGGEHLLFNYPDDLDYVPSTVGALGPGVDIRADRGYIVVAPSPGYEVVDGSPVADLPGWLADLIMVPNAAMTPPRRNASGAARASVSRAALEYVQAICGPPSGGSYHCPDPRHPSPGDPSASLYGYEDGSFTCFGCQIKGRARQLAAMALGLGTHQPWRLDLDSSADRNTADVLLAELGVG